MCFFRKGYNFKDDPRYKEVKLRIVDSVDGIWIEKGTWDYYAMDDHWIQSWWILDYYGRGEGIGHCYKSVKEAKKRLRETNNFKDVVTEKYIDVE